ncbi:MAG: hypothetical protein H6868_09580 [Rhodospirillales bacterium]|nr:hypothetical protein [Rhodospirillales bacterium]
MAFLEKFNKDEQDFLVALPYRVGLWMSAQDDTGSAVAAGQECLALKKVLEQHSRGMFGSAFVHEILTETWTRQHDWPVWETQAEAVPVDCQKAGALIKAKLGEKDVDAYKQTVLSIAYRVAAAFREYDEDVPFGRRLGRYVRIFLDKVTGFIRGEQYESETLLNISYEEDVALAKLTKSFEEGI